MQIIKQKRKTLSLKIDKNGELLVKVPLFCTKKQVESFIQKNKDWIEEQQKKVLKHQKKFEIGEEFLYFGESCFLVLEQTSPLTPLLQERGIAKTATSFYFEEKDGGGGLFYTSLENSEDIKQAFIQFYKTEAKKYIVSRIHEIAEKLSLEFNKIRITSAATRWGSCSSKKNMNFSRRLVMVPKNLIDYVIIHELAHLTEMNHSKKFWDLVEKYYQLLGKSDYLGERKALKQYSVQTNF